ncbi:MAG TPA: substrate-binding domain-containing protein [Rectinemataceae bacterium]|nr:substrate-binding domain-containing protein [Rectinemataceae bacterium]
MGRKKVFAMLCAMFLLVSGVFAQDYFLSDFMGLKNGSFLASVPRPTKKYKIANITRTLMNEHWVKNKEGFEAALKHYGLAGDVFSVMSEQDVMAQANLLDTVIAKGYNAVVVSPISEKNLLPGLALAAKKGMKIINVDTAEILPADAAANGITVSAFIGSDNYSAGVLALDYIKSKLGDKKGKVAVIEGRPGDTCAIDRTGGFVDQAKKYANITVAASQSGQWDRLKSMEIVTSILRATPDIMGIYCNNDTMVLGAMSAAADLGYRILNATNVEADAGKPKTLILIGNDGVPEALEAVRDGALTGTIAQKPFLMGYAAVEVAIQALEGKPVQPRIATPIKLLVKTDF